MAASPAGQDRQNPSAGVGRRAPAPVDERDTLYQSGKDQACVTGARSLRRQDASPASGALCPYALI